uniref:BURP domain-containing protein n=1 Tax=Nelumbo nucifera TaxID=4432 RepID=A0A822ZB06_NELNU|nr:TPA_asm: hypothetical protein HUJ06_000337 [Nelumbo nucifera]
MELRFSPISAFLPLAFALAAVMVVSHAALPSEVYWKSISTNTPMPKLIQRQLRPHLKLPTQAKVYLDSTSVLPTQAKVYPASKTVLPTQAKVYPDSKTVLPTQAKVYLNSKTVLPTQAKVYPDSKTVLPTQAKVYPDSKTVLPTQAKVYPASKTKLPTQAKVYPDSKTVLPTQAKVYPTSKTKLPTQAKVYTADTKTVLPSQAKVYKITNYKDQLHLDGDVDFFFLEENLHSGTKMNLDLSGITNGETLLSRQVADAIPFSSNKLPEILHRLSIEPKSKMAEATKETLELCEAPAKEEKDDLCVTSLESMIDFSTSKLGKNIEAVSTEVGVGKEETQKHKYVVGPGLEKLVGSPVVCHALTYAYAVYYCHKVEATRAYMVPLVGGDDDGTGTSKAAKAVAVCHTDTSRWNPHHLAFQLLKVKPASTVPICHFLQEDTIAWFPTSHKPLN